VLAQERVVRAARDRFGVKGRLSAPALEGTERALAAQVRDDQRAVDTLRGKELVLGERLKAREPFVVEAVARGEPVDGEITEPMIVRVNAGDGCGDGIERVAPVDELVGVLAEARDLERLPAVRAELGVARVRPPAVAAVDGRARSARRGGRRRSGGHGGGLIGCGLIAEAAHAFAELAENVRQLSRPENDQDDRENEDELRTTNTRHRSLPHEARSMRLDLPVYARL